MADTMKTLNPFGPMALLDNVFKIAKAKKGQPPGDGLFGGQQAVNTNLSGRIEGGDILLSSERSARRRRRVRNF